MQKDPGTEPGPEMRIKELFVARADRTYLLTGGVGGFGLALAVWLVARGARSLVLTSKRWALLASQGSGESQGDSHLVDMYQRPGTWAVCARVDTCDHCRCGLLWSHV